MDVAHRAHAVTGFSPLVRRIEAAREGSHPSTPAARAELADALCAALLHALPTLKGLDVALPDHSPWELVIHGRVPELNATERGAGALEAWAAVVGDLEEWHAAWTDGPLLTLDVVLRQPSSNGVASTAARVVLHPG